MNVHRRRALVLAATLAPLAPIAPALATPLVVDLDAPGALERLRSEQPARYEKVTALLRDAERLPEQQVEGWVRTRYDADAVRLGHLLLVSYPPKRRLSFSLEKVSYVATITVALPPAKIVPAR
jgi:hypothetical protein